MIRLIKAAVSTVVATVVLIAVVVLVRTARYSARAEPATQQQARDAAIPVDSAAVGRLSEAIRIPTITYFDSTPRLAEFRKLHAFFQRAYPLVHSRLRREVLDSGTLLYTWRGADTALPPALFMGHQDVVPVEPGTEKDWTHPAFSGAVADGAVWGRGALDDKLSVLGLLEGAEALLKRGVQPRRTVIFAFGHTEEGGGPSAANTAALLEKRGVRPWFVMDEGGVVGEGLVPGVAGKVALIGVSEKGYLTLRLTARGEGGHSSMAPAETPVSIVAAAVAKVQGSPLPMRLNDATRAMFDAIGPGMTSYTDRMAMANLWLFEPLVRRQIAREPAGAAIMRTTTAATMISAGIKDNVVPQSASAMVNFRLLPGDSVAWVVRRVKEMVADERVSVEPMPGLAFEATDVSPHDTDAFRLIAQTIREIHPGATVAPYLVVGGTDAKHFYRITPNVYRFAPIFIRGQMLRLVHGTNERVPVNDYLDGVRFFTRLIEASAR